MRHQSREVQRRSELLECANCCLPFEFRAIEVAKLAACQVALEHGVADIAIVSGRGVESFADAPGTRIQMPASVEGRV